MEEVERRACLKRGGAATEEEQPEPRKRPGDAITEQPQHPVVDAAFARYTSLGGSAGRRSCLPVRQLFASAHVNRGIPVDRQGLDEARGGLPYAGCLSGKAAGVGFEPTRRVTTPSGFQDPRERR